MFVTALRIAEITLIKSDPSRAVRKLSTSKCLLQRDVSISIAALITKLNKPNERSTAGKVKSLRKDPRKAFMNPNRSATHRYAPNPPVTLIPGITAVVAQIASARIAQRRINFMP